MNTIKKEWAAWLITLAPAIYLAITWDNIPDQVPLHYNFKGEADRMGSKAELAVALAQDLGQAHLGGARNQEDRAARRLFQGPPARRERLCVQRIDLVQGGQARPGGQRRGIALQFADNRPVIFCNR